MTDPLEQASHALTPAEFADAVLDLVAARLPSPGRPFDSSIPVTIDRQGDVLTVAAKNGGLIIPTGADFDLPQLSFTALTGGPIRRFEVRIIRDAPP